MVNRGKHDAMTEAMNETATVGCRLAKYSEVIERAQRVKGGSFHPLWEPKGVYEVKKVKRSTSFFEMNFITDRI